MEIYPFHHRNLFFNIITDFDLAFNEVREILDYLLEAKAFPEERDDVEGGRLFDIRLGQMQYTVDVSGYEVVIYQRIEIQEK